MADEQATSEQAETTEQATADSVVVKFSGTMENSQGRKLPRPIGYNAKYTKFLTTKGLRAANKYPDDDEILAFVNAQEKANARQKGMNAALSLAGIEKRDINNDDQLKLKGMVKIFVAAGKSNEEARALASATLGIAWE